MNNALLTGLVSGSGQLGFLDLQKSGKKEDSQGGDFLSLLQNRLSFSGESDSSSSEANFLTREDYSAGRDSLSSNHFRPTNIWEKPASFNQLNASKKPSVKDKEIGPKDDSGNERNSVEETGKSVADSSDTDKISQAESMEKQEKLKAMLEADPEMQKLLSGLSPEEVSAIITAIENLDTETIQAIEENPQILVDNLLSELQKLPESDGNLKLQELVKSEDFTGLVSNIAGNSLELRNAQAAIASEATLESDSENENSVQLSQLRNSQKADMAELSAKAQSNEAENIDAENILEDEATVLSDEKTSSKNKEKNLETKQANNPQSEKNLGQVEGESLRENFNRVNKLESNELAGTETEAAVVEEKPQTNQNNQSAFKFQNVGVEAKTVIPPDVSQRLISSLLQKSSSNQGKATSFTYGPTIQNSTKTSNFQNNAGGNNGFSNGFSSNHGGANSSIAGDKQVPNGNNSVFLSQLLEKAEMIKTADGKKVLNLEMDPKELGKMEMELTSKDGTLTAKISAESELAKAKLEELAPQIKEHLNSQGINLSEITVDISSRHPDERNRDEMSDGKNKSRRAEGIDAAGNEQIIRKNILPNLRKVALNIQSVDLTV